MPPLGSFLGLQSPSGELGTAVPPGVTVLQVACVFSPVIGTCTLLYQPMNGDALKRMATSPACRSVRTPSSTSVTFSGPNDWNGASRPASVGVLMPPAR